jgi:membrane complex biogenesis BtpA family protein
MPKKTELIRRGAHLLIGVIHLRPLPGAPRFRGDMNAVVRAAVDDARAYQEGGADAVVIENFGDAPFRKDPLPPETLTGMAVAAQAVRQAIELPIGFNALRNDAHGALALCATCDGLFFRVNVHIGAMVTDQGLIEGQAFDTLRRRETLAPYAKILADVHVKHGAPLGAIPIEIAARDNLDRGMADALVVSGTDTGEATELEDVRRVRSVCPEAPILLGSDVDAKTIARYLEYADGAIVGSSVKRGGRIDQPVDARRVAALRAAMR